MRTYEINANEKGSKLLREKIAGLQQVGEALIAPTAAIFARAASLLRQERIEFQARTIG